MSLRLIAFGNNFKGQLGIGEIASSVKKPLTPREKEFAAVVRTPVPLNVSHFNNVTIKKVVCGSYFTFILTGWLL
jgi:alpha-tubulin suppressor-like RCC1 family protein